MKNLRKKLCINKISSVTEEQKAFLLAINKNILLSLLFHIVSCPALLAQFSPAGISISRDNVIYLDKAIKNGKTVKKQKKIFIPSK